MIIESAEDMKGREAEIALRAYSGHTDRSVGRAIELTLSAIVQMNAETVAATKSELPMFSGVLLERVREGDTVTKVPVSFTAILGDHDAGTISVAEAGRMLDAAGVTGAILETASSTPEHPRWRAVVPMSGPLPADQHREQISKLNTALEGSLAPESWSTKQGYYYGHIAGSRNPESVMVVGATLDLLRIRPTPCLVAPSRSLGDSAAAGRSLGDEFDLVGPDGGEIPGTERPSHERIATVALQTGENLHAGILAATHLVALGQWPEQFTLDAFTTAAQATRGAIRASRIAHEWSEALRGARKYLDGVRARAQEAPSSLLVPFQFADSLVPPPTSIRGYLPASGIGVIWGEPSSFKSFVALDMALSIAWGQDWHGRPVRAGTVWYLAGEGQSGIERRVRAWAKEHGRLDDQGRPLSIASKFFLTPSSIAVDGPEGETSGDILELVRMIDRGARPSHIFVDTIARTMVGDENASRDMGAYIRGLELLVGALQESGHPACVVAVHHSRKDGGAYRGSSALRGAVDFEFEVTREDMVVTLDCRKMKDFAEPGPERFLAREVELGRATDEWGIEHAVASLVLRQDEESIQASGRSRMEEDFAPYRAAIEANPGAKMGELCSIMGIARKTFIAGASRFEEAGWLAVARNGYKGNSYTIGPNAPVDM